MRSLSLILVFAVVSTPHSPWHSRTLRRVTLSANSLSAGEYLQPLSLAPNSNSG